MSRGNFHEDYRGQEVASSSNRSFGIVFAVVFAIVALWPLTGGSAVRIWAAAVAGALLVIALLCPSALAPLNRVWTAFGSRDTHYVSLLHIETIMRSVISICECEEKLACRKVNLPT